MGNCRKTGCCQDPDLTCYDKNPWWSECLSSCKEGIHDDEPKKIQGKWSCTCNATAKKTWGSRAIATRQSARVVHLASGARARRRLAATRKKRAPVQSASLG